MGIGADDLEELGSDKEKNEAFDEDRIQDFSKLTLKQDHYNRHSFLLSRNLHVYTGTVTYHTADRRTANQAGDICIAENCCEAALFQWIIQLVQAVHTGIKD